SCRRPISYHSFHILCGVFVAGNGRKHCQIVRGTAPVVVQRNHALLNRPARVTRENGSMYHICATQCQTQFALGKKFVGTDGRAAPVLRVPSSAASLACVASRAMPERTAASTLAAPNTTCPALRASPRAPNAAFASRESTMPPRSGGTATCRLTARLKWFFVAALSTVVRLNAVQQPRPGRLRFRSGTTDESGP